MLPSIYTLILATLSLAAIPEAARATERKKRALREYDAQSNAAVVKPVATQTTMKQLRFQRWFLIAIVITSTLASVFLFMTPAVALGHVGTSIRAHLLDLYLLGMLFPVFETARALQASSLVSREGKKPHVYAPFHDSRSRQRLVPYAVVRLNFLVATAVGRLHGGALMGLAILSITLGSPSQGFTASVFCFYIVCASMCTPPFDERTGALPYGKPSEPLFPYFCLAILLQFVAPLSGWFDKVDDTTSAPKDTFLDTFGKALIEDESIGNLTELCLVALCAVLTAFSANLATMAYRFDVDQVARTTSPLASPRPSMPAGKESWDSEYRDSDFEDREIASASLQDLVDANGRRPVPLASIALPPLSMRQLPTFTASMICLSATYAAVLIDALFATSKSFPHTIGFAKPANIYKLFAACALLICIPLTMAAALIAAQIMSPSGARGLWNYKEEWAYVQETRGDDS